MAPGRFRMRWTYGLERLRVMYLVCWESGNMRSVADLVMLRYEWAWYMALWRASVVPDGEQGGRCSVTPGQMRSAVCRAEKVESWGSGV